MTVVLAILFIEGMDENWSRAQQIASTAGRLGGGKLVRDICGAFLSPASLGTTYLCAGASRSSSNSTKPFSSDFRQTSEFAAPTMGRVIPF